MLILKSLRRLLVYIYIYKILGSFGTSGVSLKMVFRHGGGVAKQLDIIRNTDLMGGRRRVFLVSLYHNCL